jgi:hypothetical protein
MVMSIIKIGNIQKKKQYQHLKVFIYDMTSLINVDYLPTAAATTTTVAVAGVVVVASNSVQKSQQCIIPTVPTPM